MSRIFESDKKPYDWGMVIVVLSLCSLGVLMVYSSSSAYALDRYGDQLYFLKRHVLYLGIGVSAMLAMALTPHSMLKKLVYPGYLAGLTMLAAVLIPGVGKEVGGATRWADLGFLTFQPSEIAKYCLVLYLAYSLTKKSEKMHTFSIGFMSHAVLAGLYIVLLLLEPDFGLAAIVLAVLVAMLFVGGIRFVYLAATGLIALLFVTWAIMSQGYRIDRIMSFLNPWQDPLGSGYQAVQSFTAFGLGGLTGTGLGNSSQKLFFLPEAHTDFIFSIIGEELGFLGVAAVILAFGYLLFRGIRIAARAHDRFSCYLVFGCIMLITLQAATNMAVAVGLFPTKGLTLPLVSYGGSSLVSTLGAIGVILSASRETST